VLEGFRPGVAATFGVGPDDVPERTVYCSITGFGSTGLHAGRAGHDLNYLGWAGVLEHTAPALPPVPIADLGAGAMGAVTQILAALFEREQTGRGRHVVVSMTRNAQRLASRPMLTGGLACYRIYRTSDDRWLTVAALEPVFWQRLVELIGRPDLADRHYAEDQEALAEELAAVFVARPLADWLELFENEDVCVGPVASRAEAATDLTSAT